jgi:hypothetical protein
MFENENDFRKLVAGLKIDAEPNPAHRERLRREMLATFEQTKAGGQRTEGGRQKVDDSVVFRPPSSVFRSPVSWLAIAAAILVVAGIGVWSLRGHGPMTFHQVRLATQKMPWVYAVVTRYQGDDVRVERHWCNFAAQKAFARMVDDGGVVAWEYGADPKKLSYSPRLKTLLFSDLSAPGSGGVSTENLPCVFAVFAAKDDGVPKRDKSRLGSPVAGSAAQYDGRTVQSFEIEQTEPGLRIDGKAVGVLKATMMADSQTKRVVAADVEYRAGTTGVLAREEWIVSYPSTGPASVFALGVPTSTARMDSRRQRIGTPGAEPLSPSTPASGFRLAPVEIQLPKPMFDGTPRNLRMPNLERPRGLRPPFLAPVGTTNVALGKPVSSREEPVIGSLNAITDGDKEATEGSFVELGPGPQYVTIDLQEQCEIEAVLVWHYHQWARVYADVVVQVSDDPAFKTGVRTIFNNDTSGSLGLGAGKDLSYVETYEGKLIEGKGARGRYVRLFSDGNSHDDLNHYIEVEVYGRPVK